MVQTSDVNSQEAGQVAHNLAAKLDEETGAYIKEAYYRYSDRSRGFDLIWRSRDERKRLESWSNYVRTDVNPDLGGLIVEYVDARVTVLGRNLHELVYLIAQRDVGMIWEQHVSEVGLDDKRPYIEKITWEPR